MIIDPRTKSEYIIINKSKDRQPRYHTLEQDIRMLSAELYRLTKLPYKSWNNINKIQTLDKQIEYLEELLSAYEQDQKKLE